MQAQHEQRQKEETFRIYTADTLLFISESVSKALGGRCMANRYSDFTDPQPEETRTPEEIIADIGEKLNRMGGEDNGGTT